MNFPLTGLQMVTGSEIQVPNFDMGPAFGSGPTKKQEISPNPLAVTAILCSLAGLVLSFVRSRSASVIAAIAGGIGFLFLLGLKAHLDQEVLTKGEGLFVVEYRIGFVAACFLLAAGAAMHGFLIRQTPEKSP